jgi:sugar diacid utilization regulator
MGSNRAIAYAEDALGVHRTWLNTEQLTTQLADLYRTQANFETETRNLDADIERTRQAILVEEAGLNPDMAPTSFERHVKLAYARSQQLATMNQLRLDAMARRDSIGAQIKSVEVNHRGHVGRLNELGGYLRYLAAVKESATVAQHGAQEWPY